MKMNYTAPYPTINRVEAEPRQSLAAQVWEALVICAGASGAILVGGLLVVVASGQIGAVSGQTRITFMDCYQYVIVVAAIPWAGVAVLLAILALRYMTALLELVTGKDLDNSGGVGDWSDVPDRQIVPTNIPDFTLAGIHPDDWRHFIRAIVATEDWSQTRWRGSIMPSGSKCDNEMWKILTGELKRCHIIVNARRGATGNLAVKDADRILFLLGLNKGT